MHATARGSAAIVGIALAACLAPTGAPTRSPGQVIEAIAPRARVMAGLFAPQAFQSLATFGPLMEVQSATTAATRVPVAAASLQCAARQGTPSNPGGIVPAGPPLAEGLFPDSLLRHVFVYIDTLGRYESSTDTSGPAGGVRFTLYAVDAIGSPLSPLQAVGWADLRDRSAPGAPELQVDVHDDVAGPVAAYLVSPKGTQSGYTAIIAGTIGNATGQVTIGDSTSGAPRQVGIAALVEDSAQALSLHQVASRTTLDFFDNNYAVDATFTSGTDSVRIAGTVTTYCLLPAFDDTVSVNGTAVALVTTGQRDPIAVRPDRGALDPVLSAAVLALFDAQRQTFRVLAAFAAPATQLLPP